MKHLDLREKDRLVPRDICMHKGDYFGVWASAKRLRVANHFGELGLDFRPKDRLVIESCFVANRFLVVTRRKDDR